MFQFTVFSFMWLLLSLLLGLVYAFIFYRRQTTFPAQLRKTLFALRFLVVAVVCFLLFAPFIRRSQLTIEKPVIVFVQDNSASISLSEPEGFDLRAYKEAVYRLQQKLASKYSVRTLKAGTAVRDGVDYKFNEKGTDLNAVFKYINDTFSNLNIGAVILASDGIYNLGGNPLYEAKNLKSPIYAIALGDTVSRKDLLISNVNYNTIAYTGNDFQTEVSIEAYRSKGKSSILSVYEEGKLLLQRMISISSDEFHQSLALTLPAGKKGIHRFLVKLSSIDGELSVLNNQDEFFVEVLDGKQKVLIWASAPHPDIAALKQGLEANKNYEVKTSIEDVSTEDLRSADLIILHQVPSATVPLQNRLRELERKPLLFILGSQSNLAAFSSSQNVLEILSSGSGEEVIPKVNNNFYTFTLDEKQTAFLQDAGPLLASPGVYKTKSAASVLLYQQAGAVVTSRPLLLFSSGNERKTAILAGEGFWRWRINDFRQNGSHLLSGGLLSKIVQYLSEKEDRRKFRVYPARKSFDENERVLLNAELYNDANELINHPEVPILIKGAGRRKFSFVFSRTNKSYILDAGVLPSGEYSYSATTSLGDRKYKADGRFIVSQQTPEFRQTTANHQFLNTLAIENGGRMVFPRQIEQLDSLIAGNELVKDISFENRRFEELIHLKWIFFLLTVLLSVEWFLRKRNGEV